MAENGDDPQTKAVTWDEITYSNMLQHEALLSLLLEKGIITREEYLEKVKETSILLEQRHKEQQL